MCNPFEIIEDLVEDVGDAIGDAFDWVIDEIVDPVMTVVSTVIDAALNDPVKTIAQIVAISTGNAWALPLIEGASVAADGGDLGDVLEATAKAYVVQEVGSYVGKAAGTAGTAAEYGVNAGSQQAAMLAAQEAGMLTTASVANSIIGSAVASTVSAVLNKQDPLKALVSGGISAATGAVLGQVSGFSTLPKTAQAGIQAAVTAAITKNPNPSAAILSSVVAASNIVTDIIKQVDPDNGKANAKLSPAMTTLATDMLMGTTMAAINGGDPSLAITNALMKAGTTALASMVKGSLKDDTAAAKTSYDTAQVKADAADKNIADQKSTAWEYNETAQQLQDRINEQNRLSGVYNAAVAAHNANPSNETAAAANDAIRAYNTYVTQLNTDYANTFQPRIAELGGKLDTLKQEYAVQTGDYEKAIQAFAGQTDKITAALDPVYRTSDRAFVEAMNPEFNAVEYKKINGLTADQDPYGHFLQEGQFKGLPTNAEQADRLGVKAPEAVINKPTSTVAANKIFDGRDYSSTVAAQQAATRMGMEYFTDSSGATYKILTKDEVKDKIKSSTTFGEAFAAARKSFPGQNFEWTNPETGKTGTFTTQTKTEATNAANAGSLVKVDQKVIDYMVNKILPNITDYKNFNPADLTKEEYAGFIGSYLNATDAQRQLMLKGADKATYDVIVNVLKEAPDMIKQGAKAPTSPVVSSGEMKASDYTNAMGVLKAAGTAIGTDFAGLAARGLTWANQVAGNDGAVALLERVQTGLAGQKDTAMSKLVGDEKVIAGGLASGIESAAAWMIGGPAVALASLGAIAANNSWIEGSSAVIDSRGFSYKNADEARANGVFTYRNLTMLENAQRTAMLTAAEVAGEALGIPGMRALMKAGLPIGGNAVNSLKNYALVNASEIVTESVTTAMQMAVDKFSSFGLGQNATWGDLSAALRDTALGTVVAVGAGGSAATVRDRLNTAAQVEATERDARATVTPITYNTVVAKTKNGENVTYAELLMSQQVADLSSDAMSQEFADLTPVIPLNSYVSFNGADRVAMGDLFANAQAVADTNVMDGSYVAEIMRTQGFKPSDETVSQFVGQPASANTFTQIKTYVDQNTFDIEEVKAAAAAEGYTLTDEEAQNLVGQKDEAAAITAARAEFDPKATTVDEAKQMMRDLGYTNMTDSEAMSLAGQIKEVDAQQNVADYVNPRQVTFAEAKKYLTDQGYTPTDAEVNQFVGQVSESEQATNIAAYADPRVVDESEARAAYEALGLKKPTQADVQKLLGQYSETDLAGKATANLDAARYNAIMAQLDEFSVGASQEVLDAIALVRTDLNSQITAMGGDIAKLQAGVDSIATQVGKDIKAVETSLLEKIAANEAAGLTREQATQKAIADVATELGTTKADVLTKIGATEATLNTKIADLQTQVSADIKAVETSLLEKIAANEAAGLTREQATQKAIADVATELGTSRADVLTKIGATEATLNTKIAGLSTDLQTKFDALTTEQKALATRLTNQGIDLNTAISTAKGELQGQIGNLQNVVGRGTQQATQSDLDTVINLLQTQGAYDQQYDYNGDKVIDQKDKTALETYLRSTQPGYKPDTEDPFTYNPAAGSKWASTGVFRTIEEEAAATRKAQADEAERTRQTNAAAALKTQRMGNLNTLTSMLGQAGDVGGQQVTVKQADPAKIGYIYDWNSIFANPSQEKMFASPFAQGGMVDGSDDVNEELLKLLKG
jgi:hypothetical protein